LFSPEILVGGSMLILIKPSATQSKAGLGLPWPRGAEITACESTKNRVDERIPRRMPS
jgi:hypothetical protein